MEDKEIYTDRDTQIKIKINVHHYMYDRYICT